jgi:hypothetical protein
MDRVDVEVLRTACGWLAEGVPAALRHGIVLEAAASPQRVAVRA